MDLTATTTGSVAFVFPGQGSQYVGMGKDIYEASPAARRIFEQADDALAIGLRDLCFAGPEAVLQDTINAQPAILTVSIALLEALRERWADQGIIVEPRFTAGHSLGQYSALVAAGSLDFGEAVRLVYERGRLMKESGESRPGGMAAIIGLDDAVLTSVCEQAQTTSQGIVCPANFNSPGQIVISGEIGALTEAMQLAVASGARRVVQLAVSIGSHSPLMIRAAEQFADILSRLSPGDATIPVISNVTAQALITAEDIRIDLFNQFTRSVRWAQSVQAMITGGATTFVEIGPGNVLSGLIRRINRDVRIINIGDLRSLERQALILGKSVGRKLT